MNSANNIIPFSVKEEKKEDTNSIEVLLKLLAEKDAELEKAKNTIFELKKRKTKVITIPLEKPVSESEDRLRQEKENLERENEKLKKQNLLLLNNQFSLSEEDLNDLQKMKKYKIAVEKMGRGEKI
jgi:hypothetical protein